MRLSNKEQPSQRSLRVGEEIRHALAHVFERDELRDPHLSGVSLTVTEVRLSPDLRQATVFVIPLGGVDADNVLKALKRARGHLRSRSAAMVRLRHMPELMFRLDTSFETAQRIATALHNVVGDTDARDGDHGDGEGDPGGSST